MKIGIISDTHSDQGATARATAVFMEQDVAAVFHCGDIGSLDLLTELAAPGVPVHAVLGNVDTHAADAKFAPASAGVHLYGRFGDIDLEGRRIALLHSDDKMRYLKTVSCGDFDFVFSGHSHVVHDFTKGRTRCINPGAAGRGNGTCAVLDMETGELSLFRVE